MIVVDTHAWVWWILEKQRLSPAAEMAFLDADAIAISMMSIWETAFLAQRHRVDLKLATDVWFERALNPAGIMSLPITPAIAIRAASLEQLRDPADRLIVATALEHHAPLITKDDRIRSANVVETIW